MSILTGPALRTALARGEIDVTPYDPDQISQASIDLHLGPWLLAAEPGALPLDVREDHARRFLPHPPDAGAFVLLPGRLYLASTVERIHAPRHVAVVDGKSSLARLGLQVHLTAGYIEPGFRGPITLELLAAVPLRVPVGWPICQVRFCKTAGAVESYADRGHYADAALADGPQVSRSHLHHARHV